MPNMFKPSKPFHLYKDDPNAISKDSLLYDRVAREHIEMGGTIVYAYRYIGTPPQDRDFANVRTDPGVAEPIDIGSFLGIQDPVFMENRDRVYDFNDVPRLRGAFKVSQDDVMYGRFGFQGLNNDTFMIEFHTNSVMELLGRRPIIGDVLEFPHLKDVAIDGRVQPKLYQVARVMRSPTGWDAHYVNHILSVILAPVRDQQEFIQFMEREDQYGFTLEHQVSTGPGLKKLNDALDEKARDLAPNGPWDQIATWIDPKDKRSRPNFFVDDGIPPDGIPADQGTAFPGNPSDFSYFLRTDLRPNRLYQFYDQRWHLKQFDKHLKWQSYAYVHKWQSFLENRKTKEKR